MNTRLRLAELCVGFQRTAALKQERHHSDGFKHQSWIATGDDMSGPFVIHYGSFPALGDTWVASYQNGSIIGTRRSQAIQFLLAQRRQWPLNT